MVKLILNDLIDSTIPIKVKKLKKLRLIKKDC
jgi:hypothetical protein